jgi:hypothetical protein
LLRKNQVNISDNFILYLYGASINFQLHIKDIAKSDISPSNLDRKVMLGREEKIAVC